MDIQEEKLKDILKSQREEFQRYLGVLAENFGSQLNQLVVLRQMVAKNTEDIEIMRMDLHIVSQTS